ncbi:hypothetical protein ASG33_09800 [Dyadobacter sp. Leaf189]|nr:hypothetical protein ASG33_09800 [Dyadobacter sp. Leaf189]
MFRNAFSILTDKSANNVLYASTANGLELLILLRSIGFYKNPILIWQHRAVMQSRNKLVRLLLKQYYSGVDIMFMFSQMHIDESIRAGVIKPHKLLLKHWGPDLDYFDHVKSANAVADSKSNELYFCSNGRENRDFPTLIEAFRASGQVLKIYTSKVHGNMNNQDILSRYGDADNIRIQIMNGDSSNSKYLAKEVLNSYGMAICCQERDYTVGLTSLFEAMALGKAIITSDNPYFPIDVEKEQIGIKVGYGDVQGWQNAIDYLVNNQEVAIQMGTNGRKLVEQKYNLNLLSADIASMIRMKGAAI